MEIEPAVKKLIQSFSECPEVLAVAIGGSRATGKNDDKSDYDVYFYLEKPLSHEVRRKILSPYCQFMEIGNHYWEEEDNCILNSGIYIDLLYRDFSSFMGEVANCVERHQAANGYTTCMWANLESAQMIYEKDHLLSEQKMRFDRPYPAELKKAIIERNMNLLTNSIVSYRLQIEKAVARKDEINVLNRVSAFLDSYFDVIYALNEIKHPGEKRTVDICLNSCKILPQNFETLLLKLTSSLGTKTSEIPETIHQIIKELEKII